MPQGPDVNTAESLFPKNATYNMIEVQSNLYNPDTFVSWTNVRIANFPDYRNMSGLLFQ